MTRVIFEIVKSTVIGPDQQSDGKTYGQILCYGDSGESLELHFLRPDTAYLNETDSANNVISNRYDPASKTGIAYYPASTYLWYESLISSAINGGSLCADVDDTYPGGNRVFTLLPLTVGVFHFVPDVVTWLKGHPDVYNALQWTDMTTGQWLPYDSWPTNKQNDFRTAFAAAWNHRPTAFNDQPQLLGNFNTNGVVLSEADAWQMYCAHTAYSLAVEMGSRVPWSITNYSSEELNILLHSRNLFQLNAAPNGYRLMIFAMPASPGFTWSFLSSHSLIGVDRKDTISRTLEWCRYSLQHFYGTSDVASMVDYWGYAGYPPVSSVVKGTVSASHAELGVLHYTAGCSGTTSFLQAVLHAANIPVLFASGGGHAMPYFITEGLYLSHGDDPYDLFGLCTPPEDTQMLLISQNTFDQWFGPQLSVDEAYDNVGRRPAELAVQYLPDYLLHKYYLDDQDGLAPQDGRVYKALQQFYPNFNDLYPDLWDRMTDKLLTFGK